MKKLSVILTEIWALISLLACLAEPSSVKLSWLVWELSSICSLCLAMKVLHRMDRLGWLDEMEG